MDRELFDEIFDTVIKELLQEICDNNPRIKMKNYEDCKNHIFREYQSARCRYKESVFGDESCLLDRHKVAACMCYAMLKVSIFNKTDLIMQIKSNGQKMMGIFYYVNEFAAYVAATRMLSMFMLVDYPDERSKEKIISEFPIHPCVTNCKTSFLNTIIFDLAQIVDSKQIGIENFDLYAYSMLFFMLEEYFVGRMV